MQHLSDEALARLVDTGAEGSEAEHLAECAACRDELSAARAQRSALRSLEPLRSPDLWPALRGRLRAEGLLDARPSSAPGAASLLLRIAAVLALFVAGTATGAMLREVPAPASTMASIDAEAELRLAEAAYLEALTRHAELSGAAETVDPVNRLAALEGIVLTTRAALREAPADPVINGYHLTALSQREAMLRELGADPEGVWY